MRHLFPAGICVFLILFAAAPHAALSQSSQASSAATADSTPPKKPDQALRIFLKSGGKKTYVRGYQWMTLDLNRKISLIESARRGAARMNAAMVQPAEIYVAEVNKFFQDNPTLMQMEVGQVIQGIAVSIKDWEDGGTVN